MIYLDTHIVVWLFTRLTEKFNEKVKNLINESDLYVSAIVTLELQYLFEVKRITKDAKTILSDLERRVGLRICDKNFAGIVSLATKLSWMRDPFDRIIVANALLAKNTLITKDQNILDNYVHAIW